MSLKLMTFFASSIALMGCDGSGFSKAKLRDGCPVGERLHFQQVKGRILGDLNTRVSVSSCPGVEMGWTILGTPPEEFLTLRRRANKSLSVVGFRGRSTGYVVRDGPDKLTYIAISLDDVAEVEEVTRAGAE